MPLVWRKSSQGTFEAVWEEDKKKSGGGGFSDFEDTTLGRIGGKGGAASRDGGSAGGGGSGAGFTNPGMGEKFSCSITNSVFYVVYLEYGHSKQAPQGMVRITLREVAQEVRALLRDAEGVDGPTYKWSFAKWAVPGIQHGKTGFLIGGFMKSTDKLFQRLAQLKIGRVQAFQWMCVEVFNRIVGRTPVDTGLAQSSWEITFS